MLALSADLCRCFGSYMLGGRRLNGCAMLMVRDGKVLFASDDC